MPYILGVRVDNVTHTQAVSKVGEMLADGQRHIITTPNPEFIVAAQKDREFRAILNQASLALPDGVGLMWAARFQGTPLQARIAGSDFVWDIARLAAEHGYTLGLMGAEPGVAQKAAQVIISRLRNCAIVKAISQPDVQALQEARPQILLVALGQVKQEKWIAKHLSELTSVKIAMGVGGALDFIAGRVPRAPQLMRLLGLEWLWRLAHEPRRLPRIFRAVVVFPWLVLREKMRIAIRY